MLTNKFESAARDNNDQRCTRVYHFFVMCLLATCRQIGVTHHVTVELV